MSPRISKAAVNYVMHENARLSALADVKSPTRTEVRSPTSTSADVKSPTRSEVRSPTSTRTEVRSPTSTSADVRSPTSTSTEVRSPTSTSTDAYTRGNVTVTGGAGEGAYTNVSVYQSLPGYPEKRGSASKAQEVFAREQGRSAVAPRATPPRLGALGKVAMPPFKVPRHMPPEFWRLPLDLLRQDQWPNWPERVARGMMAYPSPNARPLPAAAGADPISNAKEAVEYVMLEGARLRAYWRALRPVGDMPVAKAVKNAYYAGMEDVQYVRTNPPQQSVPWQDHRGILPQRDLQAQLLSKLMYPGMPTGGTADAAAVFMQRRRRR